MINSHRLLPFVMLLFAPSTPALADDLRAPEIVERMDERYTGDSSRSEAKLILIDHKGRERVRDLQMFSLEQSDVEKSILFFRSPADVAGTSYLNHDYEGGRDDDSWLYLPALKQVRRVASGDRSGAFMGSDFTYSDINGVTIDWYQYQMLDENAEIDGEPAWLIESTPKPEFAEKVKDETGYEKSHLWIRQDNFVQVQGKIWMKKGNRIKYYSASDLQKIDDIWTPMRLQMVTTRNGEKEHASVFRFSDMTYNEHTDEELFTTQAMQRGL